MKRVIKRSIMALFLLTVLVPIMGYAEEYIKKPKYKSGDIIIGHCNALTGPIAAEMELITAGDCARIWYQNHFLGGIGGHKVFRMWEDNEYNAKKSVEMYHRFVGAGAIGIISDGAPSATSLMPLTERDKIPLFEGGFEIKTGYPPRYEWLVGADYGKQALTIIYWWYKNIWAKSPDYGKRKPRVAFLYWKGGFGEGILPQAIPSLEKFGFEVVDKIVVPYKPVSVQPEVSATKAAKPDFVYINITVEVTSMILREAYSQGLQQAGVQFGGSLWNSNPIITKIAPQGHDGFLVPTPYPWETVASAKLGEISEKYNAERDEEYALPWKKTSNFMCGWVRTSLFIEAAQRAYKRVGYKLTGTEIQSELEKMAFNVPFCEIRIGKIKGQPYRLDYTERIMPENLANRFGSKHVFVCQWKEGKWSVLDYLEVPYDIITPMPESWMK